MNNVILYESTTTDFFNQGLGPLTEAKDPKVTEVGNGEFYLELDYPTTGRLFNQLKNGNLIKSDAGHELKDQRFEIKRVVKSMKKGHVSVYAEHISNQALDIALPANVTLSGSAQTALQQAQSNGLGTFKPFTMSSDITTTNSTTLSIKEFKNLKQALGGVEGSILDTWGGEYKFDNYHISLFKKRGRQANAMIAYGRNLVDLEQEENIMNTFTSVYPYAVWRDDEGVEHIIEGSVIHSEHADKYPHHKVLPVDFTLEVEDDTKPTPAILNQLATAYIENNDIGIPEVSIKLTHLDLSKTLDYKEYSEVEKLNVFDEVKIYFADFDINTTAKIVRTVWNVNLRRYDEIEVGKVRASLSDRINTIGKQISEARKEAQDARNVSMVAANGVNMVFFGPDEPTATKVGDRWFMEDGQYTISKVWDGVIWRVVSDPRLSDQNAHLIGEQQAALEEVKTTADYSYDQLQQTIANSGFTDLDTAFGNVKTLSEQAESNAYNAYNAIENFETSVIGPTGRLTLAEQFLDGFRNTAFDPSTGQLSLTEQTINGLQNTVSDPVNGLETRVTTIANGFQALSTDVDGLESQLAVTNENILARVEKGDVYSQLLIDSRNILFDANDRIMLSANKVFIDASEGTFINGAVIEDASIDSAKIFEIDANQVRVINLDADSIAGNEASFITAMFNGNVSQLTIASDSVGMMRLNDNSGYAFEITDYEARFDLPLYMYAPLYMRTRQLHLSTDTIIDSPANVARITTNGSLRFSVGANINSFTDIYMNGNALRLNDAMNIRSFGNTIRFYTGDTVSMSVGESEVNVYDTMRIQSNIAMNTNRIYLSDTTNIYSPGNVIRLITDGSTRVSVGINDVSVYRDLNLNNHTIINSSDARLKEVIGNTEINSLEEIKKWRFIDYYWKEDASCSNKQFGLISQDTKAIQRYDSENDIYGIDTSKQIMMNTHGLQQLAYSFDDFMVQIEMSALEQTMIDDEQNRRIEELEAKVKAQQEEINQLKGAA